MATAMPWTLVAIFCSLAWLTAGVAAKAPDSIAYSESERGTDDHPIEEYINNSKSDKQSIHNDYGNIRQEDIYSEHSDSRPDDSCSGESSHHDQSHSDSDLSRSDFSKDDPISIVSIESGSLGSSSSSSSGSYYNPNYITEPAVKCRGAYPPNLWHTRHWKQPCQLSPEDCTGCYNSPYRVTGGACNNELGLGKHHIPYLRIGKARYVDGVSKVFKFTGSGRLPSPRLISQTLFKDKHNPQGVNSLALMQWGQVVTHDVGYQEEKTNEDDSPINCCKYGVLHFIMMMGSTKDTCLPIPIPKDDPFYSKYKSRCMNFVRSEWEVCDAPTPGEPNADDHSVQQINHVSSFVDLSIIYGDEEEIFKKLRLWKGGLLKTRSVHPHSKENDSNSTEGDGEPEGHPPGDYGDGTHEHGDSLSSSSSSSSSSSEEIKIGQEFPPLLDEFHESCHERSSKENVCYFMGDERVNEHPWLTSYHVVLIREHNRVAKRLSEMHPQWDDERLFQEARRIVIAVFQLITYRDFLPRIVGKKILERMNLEVGPGAGGLYNATVNPSTMSIFSTAAFRYLHSIIEGQIQTQGEGRCPIKTYDLSDIQFFTTLLEKPDHLTSVFRGMTNQPAQSADSFVTKEVTNNLFKIKKPFGQDLVSIDIQRGRDHGLPTYNDMREMCGLSRADDFEDFKDVMSEKSILQLKKLYRSANDVDLLVGGGLEDHCVDGDDSGLVGPTFGCIITDQFYRWRAGDKYFFDHVQGPGKFTKAQLKAIMKVTLSTILCENLGDLKYMQADAFSIISKENPLKPCKLIPRLDMRPWADYRIKKNHCSLNKHGYGPSVQAPVAPPPVAPASGAPAPGSTPGGRPGRPGVRG